MDFYKLHSTPKNLHGHHEADSVVPERVMSKVRRGMLINDAQKKTIAKSARHSYEYAYWYLEGPFPMGEDAIATDAYSSYEYAKNVLRKPFPKGEPAILTKGHFIWLYSKFIIEKRWPKGEEALLKLKDSYYALIYAQDVVKKRWPEAEPMIAKDPIDKRSYEDKFGVRI
jgi:hypothetical protein